MKTKPIFYSRLSAHGKQCYDALEELRPHSEKYIELMDRSCPEGEWKIHTEQEVIFLAKTDLITLTEIFPDEADWYMNELCWD